MSTKTICDGCDAELRLQVDLPDTKTKVLAVVGTGPVDVRRGISASIPRGKFHLCAGCAGIAFEHLIRVKTIGQ